MQQGIREVDGWFEFYSFNMQALSIYLVPGSKSF